MGRQNKQTEDALRRRLAWACRRGMLELDVVLASLAQGIKSMPSADLALASEFLEKDDDELYQILVLRSREPEEELKPLLALCAKGAKNAGYQSDGRTN